MRDWIQAYLAERRPQVATSTLTLYAYWLDLFAVGYGGRPPDQVAPRDLESFHQSLLWRQSRRGRLHSAHTIDQALRMVRAFLRWATQAGHLDCDPTRDLVLPRCPPQPQVRPLTPDELARLLDSPDPASPTGLRDRAILALCADNGLSCSQLTALNLEDLDPDRRQLQVSGSWHDLGESALQSVRHYLAQGRPHLYRHPERALFLNAATGHRLPAKAVMNRFYSLSHRAGLGPGVTASLVRASAQAHARAFHQRRFG